MLAVRGSVVEQRGALLEREEEADEAVTVQPRQIQGKDTMGVSWE